MPQNLEEIKKNALNCPFCGSDELSFTYRIINVEGDLSFTEGGIKCDLCLAKKCTQKGTELPSREDEIEAYNIWNRREKKIKEDEVDGDKGTVS